MLVLVGFTEKVASSGCTSLFAVLRDGEICSNRSCLKHICPFFFCEQGVFFFFSWLRVSLGWLFAASLRKIAEFERPHCTWNQQLSFLRDILELEPFDVDVWGWQVLEVFAIREEQIA